MENNAFQLGEYLTNGVETDRPAGERVHGAVCAFRQGSVPQADAGSTGS